MWPLIKKLGSLNFALFLIASLAVLLGVSTFIESYHGTPFAQKVVYNAGWFDVFLALVWINIFCSTLTRWPFKKKHIGFVVTHVGILLLLIGALLSRLCGVEGQMSLFENEAKQSILRQGWELRLLDDKKNLTKIELAIDRLKTPLTLPVRDKNLTLTLLKVYENSLSTTSLAEGLDSDPLNRAVHVHLSSERVGVNENLWLMEKNADDPHSFFKAIGPATIRLKPEDNAAAEPAPKLLLYSNKYEKSFSVDLDSPEKSAITLEGSDLVITKLRYYGHAKIVRDAITESPSDIAFNPAVEFEIADSKGHAESHTRFLLFPDFPSLRGGKAKNRFDLKVALFVSVPESLKETDGASPSLTFFVNNGNWSYQSVSSKGTGQKLPLEKNKPAATGWMDMIFKADELLNHAKMITTIEKMKPLATQDNNPAILLSLDGGKNARWISTEKEEVFETKNGPVKIALAPLSFKLPFALRLVDFRKIDYPGTNTAKSYESDVVLFDPKEKVTIERTIRMNKPLDYAGFRIFQSSFSQDPQMGESSVFTIAKNPGIRFIYSGALIILIGVIILFYLHPFFNGSGKK